MPSAPNTRNKKRTGAKNCKKYKKKETAKRAATNPSVFYLTKIEA